MFHSKTSEKGPTHLNRQEIGRFLNLSNDALKISYTGPGTTFDIGVSFSFSIFFFSYFLLKVY